MTTIEDNIRSNWRGETRAVGLKRLGLLKEKT